MRRPVLHYGYNYNSLSSIPVVQSTIQNHHGGLHTRCFNSQVYFANTTEPTAEKTCKFICMYLFACSMHCFALTLYYNAVYVLMCTNGYLVPSINIFISVYRNFSEIKLCNLLFEKLTRNPLKCHCLSECKNYFKHNREPHMKRKCKYLAGILYSLS